MSVDAEYPAELRAQVDALGMEIEQARLIADVSDVAYFVASDLEAGYLTDPVDVWFRYEVRLAVRRGLEEQIARRAVVAGFQEVFGEEWTP